MGLFSKILSKLGLKKDEEEAAPAPVAKTEVKPTPSTGATSARPAPPKQSTQYTPPAQSPRPVAKPVPGAAPRSAATAPAAPAPAPMAMVDVMEKLEKMAAGTGLDWKVSIVDLLKVLDIDSSLQARKELAEELGCTPDVMKDNVKMNVWLHKTVLAKIAENGGNIPKDLLD
jgi:type IV secretory pathway VirB10-like protein